MRKRLSHHGAVRSREGDPCHDRCPFEQVSYLDPINEIYSVVLSILAPQLQSEGWNKETRGDICESLMGFAYLVQRGIERGDRMNTEHVADIIDEFSWMAYRLATTTGSNFSVWVQWITGTVA